ncbi:MFS transporter [Pseudomonas sp. 10S4]|uniref:MFS transporter n=1 Tax=Pseudomonas sp. 10S4 TaxID=3048583 RepID=UPI002AC9AC23|nr:MULTISPECIES: MFS transporter [unclassified Pseudomonas]MEB0228570.1 MFS transporter [Pseudomonas sp. 5S1]MEB0297594.1 MFS transporter [Pseudomonas sp. 10S4]WPX19621.1 MFS transporter [Pseudomonas sp. 10S4]
MDEGKSAVSLKKRRAAVILLMTMVLLGVFPLDVLLPSFPALAEHFQTTSADIAFSISLFAVGIALSQLLIGPLSDTIGRKGLLLAGMLVSIIGAAGCLLSTEYSWFLLFRVIQAIGCGCFVLTQALVQDLFEGKERDRLRILMVTASGIFISISPLAGTLLQQALDWPGSFVAFIALASAVFLKACFLLENQRPTHVMRQGIVQSYRLVYRDAGFLGYWLIAAIAFACHFSFIVISPLIFMDQLQLSPYEFSLTLLLYGLAYIIGGIVARLLGGRIAPNTQILTGLGLILFSGLVMLMLSTLLGLSTFTVLIPMIICTAGTTIARPIATSKAMEVFPDKAGTSAAAGNTLIFIFGGLISALINLSATDLQSTLALSFLLLSATGIGLNALITRRHRVLTAG